MNAPAPTVRLAGLSVSLRQLRFSGLIGVLPQERAVASDFTVSLTLHVAGADQAVFADRLEATVDYAQAYALVRQVMQRPHHLLEHAAGAIGQALLARFPRVVQAEVEICKVNPPMGAASLGASVRATFTRPAAP